MKFVLLAWGLGLSSIGQAPRVAGDPTFIELLRDAQTTNEARTRSGELTATLSITSGSDRAVIKEEIEWSGSDYRLKYQIFDSSGFVEGTPHLEEDLARTPKTRMMVLGNKIYAHNNTTNTIHVSESKSSGVRYFELAPRDSWFRCCPPQGRKGRPWIEMIGPHPAFPTRNVEGYSVTREGANLIKLVRHNKNGSSIETLFSVDHCMNPVKHSATVNNANSFSRWIEYRWHHDPSGTCVLDELDYRQGPSTDPTKADFRYRLHIDSINLRPSADSNRFTLASFAADLRNVRVLDRASKNSTVLNLGSQAPTKDLSNLADQIRSRGFAKP